jgi:hypothetical protein
MSKSKIDLSAAPSQSVKAATLEDAYQEEPYLRPENIGETLLEKLPSPTGWRILILPYRGVGKTTGGIALPNFHASRVCFESWRFSVQRSRKVSHRSVV